MSKKTYCRNIKCFNETDEERFIWRSNLSSGCGFCQAGARQTTGCLWGQHKQKSVCVTEPQQTTRTRSALDPNRAELCVRTNVHAYMCDRVGLKPQHSAVKTAALTSVVSGNPRCSQTSCIITFSVSGVFFFLQSDTFVPSKLIKDSSVECCL